VVAALAVIHVAPSVPAAANGGDDPTADLPAGFTDGVPVGGDDAPAADAGSTPEPAPDTRAATERYFGRAPWEAIRAAASTTSRPCSISDNGLTALVVAPVFKESSAATTAATAPSPMTLSRYDEWSGTYATTSNSAANYGLYAFRNPDTPYKRAFWHPGIGIWQYDSAGVGAPFTAIERMDVRTSGADVARGMAARYCNPSPSVVGHGAPFSGLERRYAAWTPWGYPCTLCEQEFQAMTAGSTPFSHLTLVDGISVTGGAQQRTCTLAGVAGTVTCWYVDPSVGTIEGSTSWARIAPLDGGSPTTVPTPLAAPFYVVDRGATEERHWLRSDTGYRIDISGSRQIGTNERPRSNQPGSGVTWRSGSGLCDLTTGAGSCVPPAPAGLSLDPLAVSGTFRPIALDADGDGVGDVLWYAPGATRDYLWRGTGSGAFASSALDIGGTYQDVLPLDVDADGDDDLLWYNRSTGASYLWLADHLSWRSVRLARPSGLQPMVIDTDGDRRDEVLWYGPGSKADALWSWTGSAFASRTQSVGGSYVPLVGDFDGNGKQDVFWYGPGASADHLWLSTGAGTHRDVAVSVGGSYVPLVGDFDGDGSDDVFWYGPGRTPDNLWYGAPGGAFDRRTLAVGGTYQPVVADLGGDGRDDVVWYAPGPASDAWWRWSSTRAITSTSVVADGTHRAVAGRFSQGGGDGILWYAAGATPDGVWWR
jgi:hypothetical protein